MRYFISYFFVLMGLALSPVALSQDNAPPGPDYFAIARYERADLPEDSLEADESSLYRVYLSGNTHNICAGRHPSVIESLA